MKTPRRIGMRLLTQLWIPAMAALTVAFGALQYRWLDELSARDRESRQHHLAADVLRFSEEFDGELTRAYFAFQFDADAIERRDAAAAMARWEAWKSQSRHACLVRDVWIAQAVMHSPRPAAASARAEGDAMADVVWGASAGIDAGQGLGPKTWGRAEAGTALAEHGPVSVVMRAPTPAAWKFLHLDAVARSFDERALPSSTEETLRRRLSAPSMPRVADGLDETDPFLQPIDEGTLTIFVPLGRSLPFPKPPDDLQPGRLLVRDALRTTIEPAGFAIVQLDQDCIVGELLPALAKKYFSGAPSSAADGLEYRVTVVSNRAPHSTSTIYASEEGPDTGAPSAVDATAPLLGVRWPGPLPVPAPGFGLAAGTVQAGVPGRAEGIFSASGAAAEFRVAFGMPPSAAPWQLKVTHRAGSLEVLAAQTRQRNLLLSAVILALLAGSFVLALLALRRARELTRQQLEFVAGISHELRTPVAVVCMTGANLADGLVPDVEQVRRYGRLIQREGRRLTEMTEQVLSFARIESGALPLPELIEAPQLAERAIEALRPQMDAQGVDCTLQVEGSPPPVLVDSESMERAVQNLISNALKYGGESRELRVAVGTRKASGKSWVFIAVEDRGIGVHADEMDLIFEPFRRGRAAIERNLPGTGLGLSLVRRVVQAHGGEVHMQSEAGMGSTFTILLPTGGAARRCQ